MQKYPYFFNFQKLIVFFLNKNLAQSLTIYILKLISIIL